MYKNIMNEMLHVSTSLTAKAVKLITVFQYESRLRFMRYISAVSGVTDISHV